MQIQNISFIAETFAGRHCVNLANVTILETRIVNFNYLVKSRHAEYVIMQMMSILGEKRSRTISRILRAKISVLLS